MRIIIPGGSGHLGAILASAFHRDGHDVVVLSRTPRHVPWRMVQWDGRAPGPWTAELENADVLINLTGRSVNCRYGRGNRAEILNSRVDSTRLIGQAMRSARNAPRVWLQAGTATLYAHRFDAPNDEATGVIGGSEPDVPETWRFSIEVAKAWERVATEFALPGTRQVLMRTAMVMSTQPGGVFETLLRLTRCGLGGPVGDGRQYVSWIHEQDFVRAVRRLIEDDHLEGPVNLAAPNPLPYREFMRALRQACGIRLGLPASRWMLEVATFVLRTESELVLKSRRVIPGKLLESTFTFRFSHWAPAAADLVRRWRDARARAA